MAGPWEKFATEESGPWAKFQPAKDEEEMGVLEFGKEFVKKKSKDVGNLVAGGLRGAASLGATAIEAAKLNPVYQSANVLLGQGIDAPSLTSRSNRLTETDDGLRAMGADTNSIPFAAGKLGTEIAGTAGVGGMLANGARAVGVSAPIVNSLASGGLSTGAKAAPLLSGSGVTNLLTRGLGGAVTGGASAGLVNPEDAGIGAVLGGALPVGAALAGAGGQAAGKALRGGGVSTEVAALAKRAKELGINIPADRLVDSKPLNALSSSLNYVPFSGRAGTEAKMTSQLNKALSRTFGQDSENVTLALRKADDVLGQKFDDFLTSNTVRVDKKFIDDLAEAANQASRELGADGASIIGKQVEEIIAKASTGEIDGQAAYNIKRTLDRIGKRNTPEAWYAIDLKQKLMEVLDRSVGPEKAAGFADLRKQYGNMLSLQKLATNGAEGEISVARLANMKNIRSPELQELADISAQFVKPREGQHGAMQRAVAGMAASSLGGLPALAAGAAAGRGTNMLLNSDLARNSLMGVENPMITQNLNKLLDAGFKTAPVVSAQ
jgi:hypothetical protein